MSCKNEEDPNKNEDTRVFTLFLLFQVYGEFLRGSRAANSAVHGPFRLNFKLSPNFMVILVTCKNEEDPVKNEGAKVLTTSYVKFSDAQGLITPESKVVSSRNFNSFRRSCMSSSPARMKMIQSKGARVITTFFPIISLSRFFQTLKAANSAVLSPIWPNFELVLDVMDYLVTCKYSYVVS